MPRRVSSANVPIYQLKVTLTGIKPPIWRRIQMPSDMRLDKLHQILQVVMGWTDSHLHQFSVGHTSYGILDPDLDMDIRSERTVQLSHILPSPKAKCIYEYDFGDSWEHELVLEQIVTPDPATRYPICLAGKRACPPEDCGGVWGYAEFLEAIHDPDHPEHETMLDWIGGNFDPEAFDLDTVNRLLTRIR